MDVCIFPVPGEPDISVGSQGGAVRCGARRRRERAASLAQGALLCSIDKVIHHGVDI